MRVVVVGGTGHIGSFLTPRLVEAGHTVLCLSRGLQTPYREHTAWKQVTRVEVDRAAEEKAGQFGVLLASLAADAVVDLTCYTPESAEQLLEGLQGTNLHLLHCGTIWVHGHSELVPTLEDAPRRPFGDYGIRKAAIEKYLLQESQRFGLAVTILHPGHLVGPGWAPVNPAGNFNPAIFSDLLHGREVALPNLGMETLHHVHADDVAACFVNAIARRQAATGKSFHVVSAGAITLRGYAERMAAWFGQTARLRFLPWELWRETVSEKDARVTLDHIAHSPRCSIARARAELGYEPRSSSISAVCEAVEGLIADGRVA
jgi:nucleoside-diphosphate-sugar epimerase